MKLPRPSFKTLVAAGASAAALASGGAAYAIYDAASTSTTAAPSGSGPTAATTTSPPASPASSQLTAARAKANASTAPAAAGARARRALGGLVIGELTSVSTTGGAVSQGTISVRVPDGQTVTASLAKRTRIFAYQGPGTKPTAETLAQLKDNEMVAIRIVVRRTATGSSAAAAASAAANGSFGTGPVTLAATSQPSATGTSYAALILDLGYTAAS